MNRLYIRIWLAVVLAVAILTFLVGWAWRTTAEAPLREVIARNAQGEIVGQGIARFHRAAPSELGATMRARGARQGPEFDLVMNDGAQLHIHLPRPPQANWRTPFGFFWTLGLVAIAVALATYPIVRRLTRRLEELQADVARWGDGDLSVRVRPVGTDEVAFLAKGFNHAAQQIQSLIQSRDALLISQKSLLANASHELRSPLTRIRMGLEFVAPTNDRSTELARTEIARSIAELDLLIDEILLASRLDAQEADMGTIEPVEVIGLVAEECARAQIALEVAVPSGNLTVPGVAKLLRRAVRNLLENANRHGQAGAVVFVAQLGDMASVRVCDAGPGVPDALKERIFEAFYRLPGASERDGGVGLGLALVKSIALRHGGSVQCSNRVEGGACFDLCLPLPKNEGDGEKNSA